VGFPPDPRALEVVAHRGPDGSGWHVFDSACGPVVLGHRRLAIIDVSEAARQPMTYQDGRYWAVYNGEIYNYPELRDELERAGRLFRTKSDTEVLLAAYAEWGEACLHRFVGMFAFVLYDRSAQRLFAARDRFAVKPLYYFRSSQGLAFASEIKQLLGLPGVTARLRPANAFDFLSSGITDHAGETMFEQVRQLRNGECATVDLEAGMGTDSLPVRRWYRLPVPGSLRVSEREAADRFRHLLAESVRLHLRSDVPVGSCLSGGLDSSAIVSLIDREFRGAAAARLHTVSACYDEPRVDERPYVEAVVAATRTEPHYLSPGADDVMASAERMTWHHDEPFIGTSMYAQWCVFAEAARQGIKVMLDGQGADEQLAGYHSGFSYYLGSLLRRGRLIELVRTVGKRRRLHGVPVAAQLRGLLGPHLPSGVRRLLLPRDQAPHPSWLSREFFAAAGVPQNTEDAILAREGLGPIRSIGDLCVFLVQAGNLPMLLRFEDRNSMAHGIEARVPFLDHRLVEWSIGLGDRYKMAGGETKRVLRRAMAGIMPDRICRRPDKLGFPTPEEEWFRGPLRGAVEGGIEDTLKLYPDLFNGAAVRTLMRDQLAGRRPWDFSLWRILNLGLWGRVFSVTV
jgi:asparagine synthase (glutamine-hydrolysing)